MLLGRRCRQGMVRRVLEFWVGTSNPSSLKRARSRTQSNLQRILQHRPCSRAGQTRHAAKSTAPVRGRSWGAMSSPNRRTRTTRTTLTGRARTPGDRPSDRGAGRRGSKGKGGRRGRRPRLEVVEERVRPEEGGEGRARVMGRTGQLFVFVSSAADSLSNPALYDALPSRQVLLFGSRLLRVDLDSRKEKEKRHASCTRKRRGVQSTCSVRSMGSKAKWEDDVGQERKKEQEKEN